VNAADPLEGKPLRYLIGTDIPDLGREGEITEVSYSTIKPTARGISVKYCNLFDEEKFAALHMSACGVVSRVTPVHTSVRRAPIPNEGWSPPGTQSASPHPA
jgi:hypothetical protein